MKIYSWNMLFRNHELDRAFTFIKESDFDIFCLQEVPEEFLRRLEGHFPHLASAVETNRLFAGEMSQQYLVCISRHPISGKTATRIEPIESKGYGRPALFTKLMLLLQLWAEGHGNRHTLHVDIATPNLGTLRVYNLHLPLKHPARRMKELEDALSKRDRTIPTIVCGDFNIIEKPHITILNWFLGGNMSDALFYKRERKHIEQKFFEYELRNPLRGNSTHPLSLSQLDHILVSRSFSIKNAEVLPDRVGSDHHPIHVEIEN